MKKLLLLTVVLGISLFAWVQNEPAKQAPGANSNAYAKGNWRMPLMQNLRFGFYTAEENDVKQAKESNLDLNLEADYFVADGWAIGADIGLSMEKTKYETQDLENKYKEWSADLSVLYGRPISGNKTYWNIRVGYGVGGDKDEDKTPSNTYYDETDYSRFRFVTGLDLRNGNSNVFVNPWIGYDVYNKTFENDDEEDFNNFKFGVRLVSSMACREYSCDLKTKCNLSRNMYNQGSSFIGYTTKGMFSFGNYEVTEANNLGSYKGNYNEGHVRLDYNYYVIDYLAIGVMGMYQYTKDEGDDYDFESTDSKFTIGPKITGHIPVDNCWRNFFGEAGVAFGGQTQEYKSGANSSKNEHSLTNFWGGVGYNFVISPNLSFTPIFDYVANNKKEKDGDDEEKRSGANFRFGIRYTF